jgi:hypothetical protein
VNSGVLQLLPGNLVGRVLFNPPSFVEWRVKANPPYTCGYLVKNERMIGL